MSDTNNIVSNETALHANANCRAVAETLSRIGDKWTVLVVYALRDGTLRYSEIRRAVSGISQRMLTLTLKGLERDGIIERTVYPTIPPCVEYKLTELGWSLLGPLQTLLQWAVDRRPLMVAARERFDTKSQKR
ncbi:winged helix-turn-helix transcriptional regulator [Klebsiella sp. 141203]|uniref:winged helix-turn-helix transcriptional regulator n=1 Tax=Klebsiella sp. 141203 TaxID=3020035 RepID=UPI0029283C7E|nr:helix-turn-helix domain-containing protein [Klebsiella sp. 141203]MDU9367304.1 helix-turn-helix domain-containing protein [Klebsiella sp. 141203]